MAPRFGRNFFAAGHPGHLIHPVVTLDPLDLGKCPFARLVLRNPEMGVRKRRDLRMVCDAQNLMLGREFGEAEPYALGNTAPDPRIDFIEDKHHAAARSAQCILDRQKDTREFTARRDLVERSQFAARVGRKTELDRFRTARATRQPRRWHHRSQRDVETRFGEREVTERSFNLLCERLCCLLAGTGQLRGIARQLLDAIRALPFQGLNATVRSLQAFEFAGNGIPELKDARGLVTVLAPQLLDLPKPVFKLSKFSGIDLEFVDVAFEVSGRRLHVRFSFPNGEGGSSVEEGWCWNSAYDCSYGRGPQLQ